MNINMLMQQAQKMQKELERKKKELENTLFSFESNGGAVKLDIYGSKKVEKITIDEDVIDPSDKDMLEDMIKIAVNEALEKIDAEMEKVISSATGGMSIPGLM